MDNDIIYQKIRKLNIIHYILIGIVFVTSLFSVLQKRKYTPIPRNEAETHTLIFEYCDFENNHIRIHFTGGFYYSVHPQTASEEFRYTMKAMERGTALQLTVNPRNDYVIELKSDTEELLDFSTTQDEIYQHQKEHIWIPAIILIILLVCCFIITLKMNSLQKQIHRQKADIKFDSSAFKRNKNAVIHSSFFLIAGIIFVVMAVDQAKDYAPISREEADTYSGIFERFDYRNEHRQSYAHIYFTDDSCYSIYMSTVSEELRSDIETLKPGTKLFLLFNPQNGDVIEIRSENREFLSFETSQEKMRKDLKTTIYYGIILFGFSLLGCAFVIIANRSTQKDAARHKEQKDNIANGIKEPDTPALRYADTNVKEKILLQSEVGEYKIVYRRVKSVNELVVNGKVYDEKKGVFEFAHNLLAIIDGHTIEAGLLTNERIIIRSTEPLMYSYIVFDGKTIGKKMRRI